MSVSSYSRAGIQFSADGCNVALISCGVNPSPAVSFVGEGDLNGEEESGKKD